MHNSELTGAAVRGWATPRLTRLGTIADVANNPGGLAQPPGNNKT